MNPSAPFILRPVATSLLMIAILLVGMSGYLYPAALGPAGSRLSHHPGADLPARRQSRRDDHVGHRAAGAPVRPDAGPEADVVGQSSAGVFGHHPAVRSEPQPRYRRAGGAGGDQCRRQSVCRSASRAAGLRQGQSRRRAGHHAGDHAPQPAAHRRSRIWPTPASPRRSRSFRASAWSASPAASGRRCGCRPICRRWPPMASTSTICAPPSPTTIPTRPRAASTAQSQSYTINANDQLQSADDYKNIVVAYRNGAPVHLSDVATRDRGRGERQAVELDEQ